MTPYYADDAVTLYEGDALAVLAELPTASVDAVVTDPPYELGFMGRAWDASGIAYNVGLWRDCLRVLKPGGHLLAFGGTRTAHRLTCAIEDAGFEIRDNIAWLYGSGFPKSLDVSKAIDKAAGAEREVVGSRPSPRRPGTEDVAQWRYREDDILVTTPATGDARRWSGWGTALKPAHEPIVVARKPLAGTVAANVLAHGTGALNIDATRVEHGDDLSRYERSATSGYKRGGIYGDGEPTLTPAHAAGRWPSNVVLDEAAAAELDAQSGWQRDGVAVNRNKNAAEDKPASVYGAYRNGDFPDRTYGSEGGASRFFPVFRYEPKAPTAERPRVNGEAHATVKPLDLMRWLVRLVTPPGGVVLDPFAGSGTTAEACVIEGFRCITVEREPAYLPLIVARLSKPIQPVLLEEAS